MQNQWFKIYLVLIIMVSLAFLSLNILAQVEQTQEDLKSYIKEGTCPNFTEVNDLTMKDSCTGIVWAKRDLPTYHGSTQPGYTWQEAKDACENYLKVDLNQDASAENIYRLPTVEELLSLIRYNCQGDSCSAVLQRDLDNDGNVDYDAPFFSNGTYWSINDYNEPDSYKDPNAKPIPGNADRDYKRSVNLLNGEVDSPVFSKNFRLNAWCVIDFKPEIRDRQFVAVDSSQQNNGTVVSAGKIKTVYNRKCTTFSADCQTKLCQAGVNAGKVCAAEGDCPGSTCQDVVVGNSCESSYCTDVPGTNNVVFSPSRIVACDTGYHLAKIGANFQCVINKTSPVTPCGAFKCENEVEKSCVSSNGCTSGFCKQLGYQLWKGNDINGYDICILDSCPTGSHQDPETYLCVSDKLECSLFKGLCSGTGADCDLTNICVNKCSNDSQKSCPLGTECLDGGTCIQAGDCKNWILKAEQTWDKTAADWGTCQASQCAFDAQAAAAVCACPIDQRISEGYCTKCSENEHYDIYSGLTAYETCHASGGAWSGTACYQCTSNTGASCGFCQNGSQPGASCVADAECGTGGTCSKTQPENINQTWQGGLLNGNYVCAFTGSCKEYYHVNPANNNTCEADTRTCLIDPALDPYNLAKKAEQNWDSGLSQWGACLITECIPSATLDSVNHKCTCPAPSVIRQGQDGANVCTTCGNNNNSTYTTMDAYCVNTQDPAYAGKLCASNSDCGSGGTCTGVEQCDEKCVSTYKGICAGGDNAGAICYFDTDCPASTCAFFQGWGQQAICEMIPTETPPKSVQAVFIVDTSPSIETPMTNLCSVRNQVQQNLVTKNIIPQVDIYGISDQQGSGNVAQGACSASLSDSVIEQIYSTQNNNNLCYNSYAADETCNNKNQITCQANSNCQWIIPAGSVGYCQAIIKGCDQVNYNYNTNCSLRGQEDCTDNSSCLWNSSASTCGPVVTLSQAQTNCDNDEACNWNTTLKICERDYDYCSCCVSHSPACSTLNQTQCGNSSNRDYCAWDGAKCVCKGAIYKNTCQDTSPYSEKCTWEPTKLLGCGNGYVYSKENYTPYSPATIVNNTSFCTEDWVASSISTMEELSNANNSLDWNSNSGKVMVLIFDESPFVGYIGMDNGSSNNSPWTYNDYLHMQSSQRTINLNKSLISTAVANNVHLSLIYTRDLCQNHNTSTSCNNDTAWNCSWISNVCLDKCGTLATAALCGADSKCSWDNDSGRCNIKPYDCSTWNWPASGLSANDYNKPLNKYCAFKRITDGTGGVLQYGATIMSTPSSTAQTITDAINNSMQTTYCDNNPADGIMDCKRRLE